MKDNHKYNFQRVMFIFHPISLYAATIYTRGMDVVKEGLRGK